MAPSAASSTSEGFLCAASGGGCFLLSDPLMFYISATSSDFFPLVDVVPAAILRREAANPRVPTRLPPAHDDHQVSPPAGRGSCN